MAKQIFYRNYNKFANSQKKSTKNIEPTKRNSKNKNRTILLKQKRRNKTKKKTALLGLYAAQAKSK